MMAACRRPRVPCAGAVVRSRSRSWPGSRWVGSLSVSCSPAVAPRPAARRSARPPRHPESARTPAARPKAPASPASRLLGLPPVRPGPVPGYVLIADRNNDRILLVSPCNASSGGSRAPGDVRPGQSFHDPDDAFFTPGYRGSRSTRSSTRRSALISVRRHRIVWSFGHAAVARLRRPDYLSNPDDAYLLPNGLLWSPTSRTAASSSSTTSTRVVREIGHAGSCGHDPPHGLCSPERRHAAAGRRRARDRDRRLGRPDQRVADDSSTPCARRRPTPPTRSCSRTGTSSSPASTRPAASTRSRRPDGSSGRTGRAQGPARSTARRSPSAGRTG